MALPIAVAAPTYFFAPACGWPTGGIIAPTYQDFIAFHKALDATQLEVPVPFGKVRAAGFAASTHHLEIFRNGVWHPLGEISGFSIDLRR